MVQRRESGAEHSCCAADKSNGCARFTILILDNTYLQTSVSYCLFAYRNLFKAAFALGLTWCNFASASRTQTALWDLFENFLWPAWNSARGVFDGPLLRNETVLWEKEHLFATLDYSLHTMTSDAAPATRYTSRHSTILQPQASSIQGTCRKGK